MEMGCLLKSCTYLNLLTSLHKVILYECVFYLNAYLCTMCVLSAHRSCCVPESIGYPKTGFIDSCEPSSVW